MSRGIFIRQMLVAAVILLVLAGCSGFRNGSNPQQQEPVYQSSQGLEIKPVQASSLNMDDLDASEVAKILDIQHWKFIITPADTQTKLNYQIELQHSSGEVEVLSSFTMVPVDTEPIDTLLAIYPLQGSLFNSAKLKFFIESGSGSTTQIVDNPFQEYSGYGPSRPAELDQDGKFLLARFSQNGSIGTEQDTMLYFRVLKVTGND